MSAEAAAPTTMQEWQRHHFGDLLCDLFFDPFHALYTAGLYDRIAPQDGYKSPIDLAAARQGTLHDVAPAGYNARFLYPIEGLGVMAGRMASACEVHYNRRVVRVEPGSRRVVFADGGAVRYDKLVSTLPLNRMVEYAGIDVGCLPDPYTSVLVLNAGAQRGPQCPDDHWVYFPVSRSGFHRVGFYSAVDERFLPYSARGTADRVSLYVERAYPGGVRPSDAETCSYVVAVIKELHDLGYIDSAEVSHPTWIDVAYTWSWPQSPWRERALRKLQELDIFQVGRYGRWVFQGIADSIRDGLDLGNRLKSQSASQ
jgi:protoporphyrinogen oxidase